MKRTLSVSYSLVSFYGNGESTACEYLTKEDFFRKFMLINSTIQSKKFHQQNKHYLYTPFLKCLPIV